MEAKQNIVENFYSHQGDGTFLHLESYILKPKDIVDIFSDKRFKLNHTEYQIFGMLLFQKVENHFLPGDFSFNNLFHVIQKLAIDLGSYYGPDGNNQEDIVKSYEQLKFKLDSRNLKFENVLTIATRDMIRTMDKVKEIVPDKKTGEFLSKVFLSPIGAFEKLIAK